jgi:hypothetical protein
MLLGQPEAVEAVVQPWTHAPVLAPAAARQKVPAGQSSAL